MHKHDLNAITWDEYFMNLALLVAKRSKDPKTKVGTVIVNTNNQILATGYNGFISVPNNDLVFPWDDNKYLYVIHSEQNAIINAVQKDLQDARVYVTLFPCNDCVKLMIQSGIKEIVYLEDRHPEREQFKAARRLLREANVKVTDYLTISNRLYVDLVSGLDIINKIVPL